MLLIWNLAVGGAWDNDSQPFTKWNANAHTHTHTHTQTHTHEHTQLQKYIYVIGNHHWKKSNDRKRMESNQQVTLPRDIILS